MVVPESSIVRKTPQNVVEAVKLQRKWHTGYRYPVDLPEKLQEFFTVESYSKLCADLNSALFYKPYIRTRVGRVVCTISAAFFLLATLILFLVGDDTCTIIAWVCLALCLLSALTVVLLRIKSQSLKLHCLENMDSQCQKYSMELAPLFVTCRFGHCSGKDSWICEVLFSLGPISSPSAAQVLKAAQNFNPGQLKKANHSSNTVRVIEAAASSAAPTAAQQSAAAVKAIAAHGDAMGTQFRPEVSTLAQD